VSDLSAVPVLLDRAQAVLERRLRIDTVQVVERDAVRAQAAKALLDLGPKHLRPPFPGTESTFRRHHAILRDRRERSSDGRFAFATGVEVGGVDVPHSGCERLLHEVDVLERVRESIPEPDPRDLGIAQPERR